MSPGLAISDPAALRDVGPDEKDLNAAGDLVAKLGAHNRGQALITAVAKAHPREVRAAQARPVDPFRSALLSRDEVTALAHKAWGENITVLGFDVRGDSARPEGMQVVVLFELKESGRTGRGVLPYAELETSNAAYDAAVQGETFDPYVIREDRIEYSKQVAKARAEGRRATAAKTKGTAARTTSRKSGSRSRKG